MLIAQCCHVLGKIVVIPGGPRSRCSKGGQQPSKTGRCGGGRILGCLLHGMEHTAPRHSDIEEIPMQIDVQIPEAETRIAIP